MKPHATQRRFGRGLRIYRLLLRLYPAAFRRRYESEMIRIFEDLWNCAREDGVEARWRIGVRLVRDFAQSAPGEWVAAHRTKTGREETFAMNIYCPSRRLDLLVGSLVSTLFVGAAIWLSDPSDLNAARLPQDPGPKLTPFVIVKDLPPPEPQEIDSTTETTPQEPAPPQQDDYPQIARPDSIVQPIEPPAPPAEIYSAITLPRHRNDFQDNVHVFDPSSLDQQPVARFQARPQYPFEMRREGVTGSVLVDFIVDSEGQVRNASAFQSTRRDFEASAIAAVSMWKFKPGRKNGHAVFTHMQVPIDFLLDGR